MNGDLIRTQPCELCSHNRRQNTEPPTWLCSQNQTGDHECDVRLGVWELIDPFIPVAMAIAEETRHVPRHIRRTFAEEIADALANAVDEMGAEFDVDVFLSMAGMVPA